MTDAAEHRAEALAPVSPPPAEAEPQPAEPAPAAPIAPVSPASLPRPGELVAAGIAVPLLALQLHVYDSDRAKRFVIINGRRYTEGATLSEGPALVSIERRGVVLRQQGRDFLLLPE
jgi:general secretion pathway protein B